MNNPEIVGKEHYKLKNHKEADNHNKTPDHSKRPTLPPHPPLNTHTQADGVDVDAAGTRNTGKSGPQWDPSGPLTACGGVPPNCKEADDGG